MDHKKSPKGRKRQAKEEKFEDHFWDCSVCTYKNNPEAFKCLMCDVRKGTSTRKPRLNPDLVAVQQVQQALTPPPALFKFPRDETRPGSSASSEPSSSHAYPEDYEEPGPSSTPTTTTTSSTPAKGKKPKASTSTPKQQRQPKAAGAASAGGSGGGRAKLRNVDRKNATVHSVTVDNVTIAITEYRLKPKKEKKDKAVAEGGGGSNNNGGGGGGSSGGSKAEAASNHSDAESDSMEPSGQDRSS